MTGVLGGCDGGVPMGGHPYRRKAGGAAYQKYTPGKRILHCPKPSICGETISSSSRTGQPGHGEREGAVEIAVVLAWQLGSFARETLERLRATAWALRFPRPLITVL